MSKRANSPRGWGLSRTAAIVVLALVAAASNPSAQQRDRYTLEGDAVAIYNIAGELRVEPGTGSAVVVEVVRGGKDAGALRVETGTRRGIQTLRVVYPGRRVVYPKLPGHWNNTQFLADDGFFGDDQGRFDRRITVSGSGSGTEAHADLRVMVPKGKKLVVRHIAGRASVRDLEGELVVNHSIGDLDVRGVRGDVSLDTGAGAVTVTDVHGDLAVDSGSGRVTLSEVRGRELMLDSGSGDVRGSGVEVEELNADTGSGEVELHGVKAQSIVLDTGSGGVELDLASDARDIVVDSGSGSVTIRVPSDFGAEFDIETSSGSIDIDLEHKATEIGRDRLRGTIGDGRGTIRIESGSGGIRIVPGGGRGESGRIGMMGTLLTHGVG
jgi:hypothetical protein